MSAAQAYSYERTILDGHYEAGRKIYHHRDALVEMHADLRQRMLDKGLIRVRGVLKMTDEDKMKADVHVDEGDWTRDVPEFHLPVFEQDPGYEAVADLLWG